MILVIARNQMAGARPFYLKNKISPPFSMIPRNKIFLSKEPV